MFDLLSQALNSDKEISDELVNSIADEDFIDEMNHGITDFLQKCSRLPNANHKDRNNFARLISVTQNLEDLSDECCSMIHTICKFKNKEEVEIFKNHLSELNLYFGQVYVFFEQTCTYIALGISDEDKFLSSEVEEKIDRTKKQLKKESRKRIEDGSDVKAELNFMDLVRKIEKAGDCVFGVVQSLSSNLEESVVNESSEGLLKAQNIIVNPKTHKVFASGKEVKLAVTVNSHVFSQNKYLI
ncbi:MAG: hypothetical protein MJ184_10155 [Treponema sp.]|nr:hypothetical protein [Treponema sp.]